MSRCSIALMLALARNIPSAHASISQGKWQKSEFKGTELYGKTLGLIGLGKIGWCISWPCGLQGFCQLCISVCRSLSG